MEDEKSWDDGLCDCHAAAIMKSTPKLVERAFLSTEEGRKWDMIRFQKEIDYLKDELEREQKAIMAEMGYEPPKVTTGHSYFGEPIDTTYSKPSPYSDYRGFFGERYMFAQMAPPRTRDEKYYDSLKAKVETRAETKAEKARKKNNKSNKTST